MDGLCVFELLLVVYAVVEIMVVFCFIGICFVFVFVASNCDFGIYCLLVGDGVCYSGGYLMVCLVFVMFDYV